MRRVWCWIVGHRYLPATWLIGPATTRVVEDHLGLTPAHLCRWFGIEECARCGKPLP